MNTETLRILRNILLRMFAIGFVIVMALAYVTLNWWNEWTTVAGAWFHTDTETMTPLVLKFFLNARFFLLFLLLTPALAIHWTLVKEKGRKKK